MKKDNINKYEAPVIIPLGELAKGSGECNVGSGGTAPGVPGNPNCAGGGSPTKSCTGGNNAGQPTACRTGDTPRK